MNNEQYAKSFGRFICSDEIVIELDRPCPEPEIMVWEIFLELQQVGYGSEIWRADGMFSPHLHLKNIRGLDRLPDEVRTLYRRFFIEKYVHPDYLQFVDFNLCHKHRIAEENKPHWKYGTIKERQYRCLGFNSIEDHLVRKAEIYLQKEKLKPKTLPQNNNNESIIKVAIDNGILVSKNGMALCPFHPDTVPSLSFNEEKGLWYCFGCNRGGNTAKFKEALKEASNVP